MIVDTMTLDEIRHELKKDYAAFVCMENEVVAHDLKNRVWSRAKTFPHGYIHQLTSRRLNHYLLLVVADSHKSTKHIYTLSDVPIVIHHHQKKGLFAYQWSETEPARLTVYHPHFFRRYAERMNLEENVDVEIVKHYFLHNLSAMGTKCYYKDKVYTASAMKEGIGLGVTQNKFEHILTFVSYDMLFKEQKEYRDAMLKPILDNLKMHASHRDPRKLAVAMNDFLETSEKNQEAYMLFWKNFAKHHFRQRLDVVARNQAEYDLVERT